VTLARPAPARTVARIATAAGGGLAAFYTFYTTAPSTLDALGMSAGAQISIVMLMVVAIQPLLLLGRNWVKNRRFVVTIALACMGLGSAILPVAVHWPGLILLGLGVWLGAGSMFCSRWSGPRPSTRRRPRLLLDNECNGRLTAVCRSRIRSAGRSGLSVSRRSWWNSYKRLLLLTGFVKMTAANGC